MATPLPLPAPPTLTPAAPPPSLTTPLTNPASSTPSQQQQPATSYVCTLHGLIPSPPASSSALTPPSDPNSNAATLPNLLSLLSSLVSSSSSHCLDLTHSALTSQHSLYSPSYPAPSPPSPAPDRPLQSRLHSLSASFNRPQLCARPCSVYERVYASASDSPRTEVRVWREILPAPPSAPSPPSPPWYLTAYARPLLPARHETLVRLVRCLPLQVAGPGGEGVGAVMEGLGFKFDYEVVKEGFVFVEGEGDGAAVEVRVYRLVRVERRHDLASVETVRGVQWVVEVSAVTGESGLQQTEDRVVRLAKALEPLVKCSRTVPDS